MIFYYKYNKGNISPGIVIEDISQNSSELEVILLPFTFVRILKVEVQGQKSVIKFNIIKRNVIIEYALKAGYFIDLDQYRNNLIIKK